MCLSVVNLDDKLKHVGHLSRLGRCNLWSSKPSIYFPLSVHCRGLSACFNLPEKQRRRDAHQTQEGE